MEYESKPLTKKQLKVFEEFLHSLQISNYSIHLSPGTKVGENFLGYITQAEVKGSLNNSESVLHFTLKVAPNEKNFKLISPVQEVYEREIYMYSKVFEEFAKFQKEKRSNIRFESSPRFYECIKECDEEMLVLENMKATGFKQWPRGQHLDYNHVVLVLKEYAKLHALSYALRDQKPELFQEIAENVQDSFFQRFKRESVQQVCHHRVANALKCLNPTTDKVVYDKFKKFSDNQFSTLINLMYSPNQHSVINHVDCGISNFLFKYETSSGSPTKACILDFQMSRLASPAVDLCTLLFSAINRSTRSRFEELILEYYNFLCSYLKQLGSDGETLLPFTTLQEELTKYGIVGFAWATNIMYVQATINQQIPHVFKDSSNAKQSSLIYDLKDRSFYDANTRDSIFDFHRLGYNFY